MFCSKFNNLDGEVYEAAVPIGSWVEIDAKNKVIYVGHRSNRMRGLKFLLTFPTNFYLR